MKTIIAGSRDGFTYDDVCKAVELSGFEGMITEVVSGTARGPDLFGEKWARENDRAIQRFPADWENKGRAAGHIRNAEMAKYADAAIILWDGKSRGTSGMIKLAEKKFDNLYIHLVHFIDMPFEPSRAQYIDKTSYEVALSVHNQWVKCLEEQGLRLR